MKSLFNRLRPLLIGAAAFVITVLPQTAFAADPIRARLDGRELGLAVAPIIENSRTLFPMRDLLEALGASVSWDQTTRTVTSTLNDTTIMAQIGNTQASVNGKLVTLDVPPRIVEDRTLVPLRFFVENFGMSVSWENETRTVVIETERATEPVVSRGNSRSGETALRTAQALVGTPYAWGGTSPDTGFDCSGFIWYVSSQAGAELPRTSQEMFEVGTSVPLEELRAGDLVFFETYAPGASHVGIYDGNGGFVHAQSAETGVKVTSLDNPWWSSRYLGARRIFQ
ncbi:MAG TPA: stalk domain-containing protein [Symbiobacteriaceae bacterium]|jgi:peptidoglycan DL-endopeptidase LytE|nr:stalk domain-containing protein [Symbiobacteriaceae bacterium]